MPSPGSVRRTDAGLRGASDDEALVFADPAVAGAVHARLRGARCGGRRGGGRPSSSTRPPRGGRAAPPAARGRPPRRRRSAAAPPAAAPHRRQPPPPPASDRRPPAPRAARAGVRPDYMSEIPSIGGDRVREAPEVLGPRPRRGARRMRRPKMRMLVRHQPSPAHGDRRSRRGRPDRRRLLHVLDARSSRRRSSPAVTPPKVEVGTTVNLIGTGFARLRRRQHRPVRRQGGDGHQRVRDVPDRHRARRAGSRGQGSARHRAGAAEDARTRCS